jgi:uncharacterized tellurite resistance protein B-like protein
MHIVLAIIGALTGLLYAFARLNRAGVSVNPFALFRRYRWQKKTMNDDPLYGLDAPINAAAVLLVGMARLEGDMSREQKAEIVSVFRNEFELGEREAGELFIMAVHLLGDHFNPTPEIGKILEKSRASFSPEQSASLLTMLRRVASLDGKPTVLQQDFLQEIAKQLFPEQAHKGAW